MELRDRTKPTMTLDNRKPKRPQDGAALAPVVLKRVDSGPAIAPRSIVLDLPASAPVLEQAPTFETVRILPVMQLRALLSRRLAASAKWTGASPERSAAARRFLAIADELNLPPNRLPPEIAVVRRVGSSSVGTIYSVINGAVFMNADRCGEWTEGREDAAFIDSLANALTALRDQRLFQGGTRELDFASRNQPVH